MTTPEQGAAAPSQSDTPWTPAPWVQDEACICGGPEMIAVAQTCKHDDYWGQDHLPPEEEARIIANGQLICAAPDLFAALQTVIDWADFALSRPAEFDSHGVRNLDGPAFDVARAALALARGGSQ